MKANTKAKMNNQGFAFIVPMTLAIVVGFAILAIGGYVIGEITDTLESSFPAAASRTARQNNTLVLLGNVTTGFSDVVDIEIIVIIITALSMAIFAIMAVGSRRGLL